MTTEQFIAIVRRYARLAVRLDRDFSQVVWLFARLVGVSSDKVKDVGTDTPIAPELVQIAQHEYKGIREPSPEYPVTFPKGGGRQPY